MTSANPDLTAALAVLANGRRPSYRARLRIERAIFQFVVHRLEPDLGREIHHIGPDLIREVSLSNPINHGLQIASLRCAERGLQAMTLLRDLASFDPYVVAGDVTATIATRPIPALAELSCVIRDLLELGAHTGTRETS